MNPRWLLRAKRLAQHPPPMWKVKLVFGVIAACLILFAVERWLGAPDWMTREPIDTRPRITTLP
ncbi:MAG: hypothetical protein HLUCCA08_14165 [Rhodobacteraceae bacterium HLUCCA08]|nr:MAG: hypothetical protein HLUCCA08_14165 [Rhodobacteraceae bacterium HLUCCA08]